MLTRSSLPTAYPEVLDYICSWTKILQCNCCVFGFPTPTVEWFIKDVPVTNISNVIKVTHNVANRWNNSTITLRGKPEVLMDLTCMGENKVGVTFSRIFLVPGKYTGV